MNSSASKNCFWSKEISQQLKELRSTVDGLSQAEASARQQEYGFNQLNASSHRTDFFLFLSQFKSPITLLLIGAAILSYLLRDSTDSIIIMVIVCISSVLGFWQERGAVRAIKKLVSLVQVNARVLRDHQWVDLPLTEIVPGDILRLSAGDAIPSDCLLIDSNELFTDEAAFTGETFPVEKKTGVVSVESPLAKRTNTLFMGSHVISGNATALVVCTGLSTEFGRIAKRLKQAHEETDFEKGIRRLGYLLMEITAVVIVLILFFNMLVGRPVFDSFLFALALAVGLTPQLLPAIISINLAKGA